MSEAIGLTVLFLLFAAALLGVWAHGWLCGSLHELNKRQDMASASKE